MSTSPYAAGYGKLTLVELPEAVRKQVYEALVAAAEKAHEETGATEFRCSIYDYIAAGIGGERLRIRLPPGQQTVDVIPGPL